MPELQEILEVMARILRDALWDREAYRTRKAVT